MDPSKISMGVVKYASSYGNYEAIITGIAFSMATYSGASDCLDLYERKNDIYPSRRAAISEGCKRGLIPRAAISILFPLLTVGYYSAKLSLYHFNK